MTFFDSCILDIGIASDVIGDQSQSEGIKCSFGQRKVLYVCTDHLKTKRESTPLDDFYEMFWCDDIKSIGGDCPMWAAGGWWGPPTYHKSVRHPDSVFVPKHRILNKQLGILFSRTGSWVYCPNMYHAYLSKDKSVDPKGIIWNAEKRTITDYLSEVADVDSRIYMKEVMEYLSYIYSMLPYFHEAKWHIVSSGFDTTYSLVHKGSIVLMVSRGLRTQIYGKMCDPTNMYHIRSNGDAVYGVIYNPAYANSIEQTFYNEYPRAYLLTDGVEATGIFHVIDNCINISIDADFLISFAKSTTMPTVLVGEGVLCFDISECLVLDVKKGSFSITSDAIRNVFETISNKIDPHQGEFEKLVRRVTILHDKKFIIKESNVFKG